MEVRLPDSTVVLLQDGQEITCGRGLHGVQDLKVSRKQLLLRRVGALVRVTCVGLNPSLVEGNGVLVTGDKAAELTPPFRVRLNKNQAEPSLEVRWVPPAAPVGPATSGEAVAVPPLESVPTQVSSVASLLEEPELSCPICQEVLLDPVEVLCCSTVYCQLCLDQWMARSLTCPTCRLERPSTRPNVPLKRLVIAMPAKCDHCGLATTRGALVAHLKSCPKAPAAQQQAVAPASGRDEVRALTQALNVPESVAREALAATNDQPADAYDLVVSANLARRPGNVVAAQLMEMGVERALAEEASSQATTIEQAWEFISRKQERGAEAASPSSQSPRKRGRQSAVNKTVNCYCGVPARLKVVRKATENQGRRFFGCPYFGYSRACVFFLWEDDFLLDNIDRVGDGDHNGGYGGHYDDGGYDSGYGSAGWDD